MRSWVDGAEEEETTCQAAAVAVGGAVEGECSLGQLVAFLKHGAAQAIETDSADSAACRRGSRGWRVPAVACSDRHRCALAAAER